METYCVSKILQTKILVLEEQKRKENKIHQCLCQCVQFVLKKIKFYQLIRKKVSDCH